MQRFMPNKEADRYSFFKSFNAGIKEIGLQLGLSAEDVNNVSSGTQLLMDKTDAVQAAHVSYNAVVGEKKSIEDTHIKLIQFIVNKMKNGGNWSDAAAKTLGVYVTSSQVDTSNVKPVPVLKIVTGLVHVAFGKKGLTGVKIFVKTDNDKDFVFLATPTVSPYIDDRPLRQAGVAEIRYYKLVGVKNDKEVGHSSDVVWIAYAG